MCAVAPICLDFSMIDSTQSSQFTLNIIKSESFLGAEVSVLSYLFCVIYIINWLLVWSGKLNSFSFAPSKNKVAPDKR